MRVSYSWIDEVVSTQYHANRSSADNRTKVLWETGRLAGSIKDRSMTDAAHTSIREPQSVARLSHTFSKSLSAVDLAEPLLSLDENQPVALGAELLRKRGIAVLGVRRDGLVRGWVGASDLKAGTLGEHL